MANLGAVIKETIRRVAKREIKAETAKTRQAVALQRRDIVRLKRQLRDQEKEIRLLKSQDRQRPCESAPGKAGAHDGLRFSARSVKAQRMRLKLSAADYGKLIGVSALTVYHWEHGKARPRKQQFAALVAMRRLGRREALARLATLRSKKGTPAPKQGRGK